MSASTLRRHAQVYEALFGPLPRERDQRRWTPEAVRHLRVAQQALSSGLVVSLEVALTRVRDGQDLPDYAAVPDLGLPLNQQLELFIEEFARLRATVEAQSSELAALRAEVRALRPVEPLTPPSAYTEALEDVQRSLQATITAQAEREGERLRVMLHALAPSAAEPTAPRPKPWWRRLFG